MPLEDFRLIQVLKNKNKVLQDQLRAIGLIIIQSMRAFKIKHNEPGDNYFVRTYTAQIPSITETAITPYAIFNSKLAG